MDTIQNGNYVCSILLNISPLLLTLVLFFPLRLSSGVHAVLFMTRLVRASSSSCNAIKSTVTDDHFQVDNLIQCTSTCTGSRARPYTPHTIYRHFNRHRYEHANRICSRHTTYQPQQRLLFCCVLNRPAMPCTVSVKNKH